MKLRLVITGLIALLAAATAQATTLKLAPDIDLLVLDGRKISGSLLKGAEGLELERGQHQLLFRVEKNLHKHGHPATAWISTPLIVTFTAQAKSITIRYPSFTTLQQGKAFNKKPDFQLVDEKGVTVDSQQDRLLSIRSENYEQAMAIYNLKGNAASVPRFAQPHTSSSPVNDSPPNLVSDRHPTGRILQLWYQQVDAATRQRFGTLMQALRIS
ncbi:DUF2057 family protein [Erwinia sp. P6884]|uniref:YccT family protein n=1 Tax=Erwinia sp. P6884 TaxID=3141450 RepID=UPI003192EFFD